jgi:hypothetical protein
MVREADWSRGAQQGLTRTAMLRQAWAPYKRHGGFPYAILMETKQEFFDETVSAWTGA